MKYVSLLLTLCLSLSLTAQEKPSPRWIDQKFSMFIHFGLYSVYGGVYQGEPVKQGYSEQIQSFTGIFSDWYGNTAKEFNPVQWNADSIVALAKEAGMRSIVFTSKHHDGFCMYHSAHTDFNIVDASPYGRDLMMELAEACRRGGIDFGVYFSLIDWHYPHGYPISSHNADPLTRQHYEYNLQQVEEIMTHYGEISEIWFDMGSLTLEQSKGLYELVHRLQPGCMISGRLGNDYVDFAVMADNEYPDYKLGVPWQTAASMFDETWGYRSWQERGEVLPKVQEKLQSLVKVVSRGGNYLLNIGPKGDGSVVPFEQKVLARMGDWMKTHGEAIYGTDANPFHQSFSWGDITATQEALYAFISQAPQNGTIRLEGIAGEVTSVHLLSSGASLPFTYRDNAIEVNVAGIPTGELLPVAKITFNKGFRVLPTPIVKGNRLTPANAMPLFGHSSLNYYAGYKSLIGYDWAWQRRSGRYTPHIQFTDQEIGRALTLEVDGEVQEVTLHPETSRQIQLSPDNVKWGSLYRKPGRGVFGNVDEEGDWEVVNEFSYGEVYTEPILPRESVVFLQEIESDDERTAAVQLTGGNAVYILLNGEYITAHFSPQRLEKQEELVLLPLRKGKNRLIIKLYNGFEDTLHYGITPLRSWSLHTIKLNPVRLARSDFHRITLRAADADSRVSPLRLNNVTIQ